MKKIVKVRFLLFDCIKKNVINMFFQKIVEIKFLLFDCLKKIDFFVFFQEIVNVLFRPLQAGRPSGSELLLLLVCGERQCVPCQGGEFF